MSKFEVFKAALHEAGHPRLADAALKDHFRHHDNDYVCALNLSSAPFSRDETKVLIKAWALTGHVDLDHNDLVCPDCFMNGEERTCTHGDYTWQDYLDEFEIDWNLERNQPNDNR